LGTAIGGTLHLYAAVCALDGSEWLTARGEIESSLTNATTLGQRIADNLLAQGAARLIAHERASHQQGEES